VRWLATLLLTWGCSPFAESAPALEDGGASGRRDGATDGAVDAEAGRVPPFELRENFDDGDTQGWTSRGSPVVTDKEGPGASKHHVEAQGSDVLTTWIERLLPSGDGQSHFRVELDLRVSPMEAGAFVKAAIIRVGEIPFGVAVHDNRLVCDLEPKDVNDQGVPGFAYGVWQRVFFEVTLEPSKGLLRCGFGALVAPTATYPSAVPLATTMLQVGAVYAEVPVTVAFDNVLVVASE
jgi:hypothetical protein